jgi:hypothetical protein
VRAVIRIRPEPAYRREAFEQGLKRLGYTLADGSRDNIHWQPEGRQDLLVLWNRKQGLDERLAETWEARGGTVLVVENAYLQKVDKSAYAISTHQHNGAGWFPIGSEDRFPALGFALKDPVVRPEGYLLLIGQRGIGSKLMASPALWGEKALAGLMGRNAKLRAHPGNFKPKVPLEVDLAGARLVHIWSSSAGVRARVEGLPVSYSAPHWICAGDDRAAALEHMAHGQWSVEEIAAGEPFARMAAANWGPKLWR